MKIILDRKRILDRTAATVLHDREATHGRPQDFFDSVARQWGVFLTNLTGKPINLQPHDVALMMILFKVVRASNNSGHGDNWIDLAGYAAVGGEIACAKDDLRESDIPK